MREALAPELHDWRWVMVNISGGKDSAAILAAVSRECGRQGYPRGNVVAVHCDLGSMEWPGALELAREHAEQFGFRFEVVRHRDKDGNSLTLLDQVRARARRLCGQGRYNVSPWYGMGNARYCTADSKTSPALRLATQLAREAGAWYGPVKILNCLGLRREEGGTSGARSKITTDEHGLCDSSATSKATGQGNVKQVRQWLPIIDWREADVWQAMDEHDLRRSEIYKHLPRLSCCFCVYAKKAALMASAKLAPELFEQHLELERELQAMGFVDRWGFTAKLSMHDVAEALAANEEVGSLEWGGM